MKKGLLVIGLLLAVFTMAEQQWKPVQYYIEWDTVPGARYRVFHAGQPMNESYFTTNELGEYTVEVPITNKAFTPWFPSHYRPNELGPLITWTNTDGEVRTERFAPTNEWSFDVDDNTLNVLQGKSQAGVKFFVVAVLNNTNLYKTSNIVGWPSVWNTESTNGFELRLIRTPLGPPMYINHNPPGKPKLNEAE